MAPRKGSSPFSQVKSPLLLDPNKTWYVLSHIVCGDRPPKYFSRNKLPARFPADFVRLKRSALQTVDGEPYQGKASSEDEIVASSFGLIATFLRHAHDSRFFQEEIFEQLRGFLNSLDLSVLCKAQAVDAVDTNSAAWSNPLMKTPTNRRLQLSGSSSVTSPQEMDEDTGCSLLTPPKSSKKVQSDDQISALSVTSPNMKEICQNKDIDTPEKMSLLKNRAKRVFQSVSDVCDEKRESLASVLGNMCAFKDQQAQGIVMDVIDIVAQKKGVRQTFEELLSEETYDKYINSMRVPDWVLVYFKIKARISDSTWQTAINFTNLGRTGNSSDLPLLMNLNQIKAARQVIFSTVRNYIGVTQLSNPIKGYGVDMFSMGELIVREQRLHKISEPDLRLMIKIDGRPFWGRDQVLVGIVPRLCPLSSTQSAKSVYPLAIANCKENRANLKLLLNDINRQKKILKEEGLTVDGRHYSVHFTVTLDYKTLLLLLVKKDDEEFVLGGRGVDVEFCFLCDAIRRCSCHDVEPDETCTDCLKCKANIGRSTGIRDDLEFLLDEELTSIQLCALHMEMRNTEQLLGSIGLVAHKIDSLKDANDALRSYGPESFKGNRLTVQKKAGQETQIAKHNIHVSSMSGPTEREILENLGDVVEHALPIEKMKMAYSDLNTAKNLILNRITFCHTRVDVMLN